MEEKNYYYTIQNTANTEFKDRGSRFLSYAFPIEGVADFKKHMSELKEMHPKAVHYCFAYRLGTDGNSFRSSDNGEPSGTAGKPMLGQIDAKNLTNVLVVTVRYFGGTLLGVPGLINAYKTATSLVLQLTPVIKKAITTRIRITFDYTQMNEVMRRLKKAEAEIVMQDLQLFGTIDCNVPRHKLTDMQYFFSDLKGVEMQKMP